MGVSPLRNYINEILERAPIFIRKVLVFTLALGIWQSVSPAEDASAVATATAANGTTVTNTYTYTGAVEYFTVPANVTSLDITLLGGQGAGGGIDGSPRPADASNIGRVTGTIAVTPGQYLSIGVGKGATNAPDLNCRAAPTNNTNLYYRYPGASVGGINPFGEYAGGYGGEPGPAGCSGRGGGGGAASVVKIGTVASPASVATIVAGGSGGTGGNGQYIPALQGQPPIASFTPRDDTSTLTSGGDGFNVSYRCVVDPRGNCDGGGGAGGGGGARGGSRGLVEFGAGSYNEYFGKGGYPGENSTGGLSGLTASYQYLASVQGNGSVVISYENGNPSAPLTPNGTPGNGMVRVYWGVPTTSGASAITSYSVEYAVSPYNSWTTATNSATNNFFDVTGLTNATSYTFRVKANSSVGSSVWALSPVLTPYIFSTAPTITSITPGDASLSVTFNAGISSFTVDNYQYSVDTGTTWTLADQSSTPITIRGLTNGRTYGVQIRAISAGGIGTASATTQGTPSTVPGAGVALTATTTGIKTFTAGYTGGSPITGYDITFNPGVGTCPGMGGASNAAAPTGLFSAQPVGTAWAYRARNANGSGAWSNCVVSSNAPSTPNNLTHTLTAQNSAIQVGWSVTTNNGPINKVEYKLDSGAWTDAGTITTPFFIGGLTNGTSYGVMIRVTNSAGTSTATDSLSATPRTVPNSPVDPLAVGAAGAANVYWKVPTSNGGSAITTYTARAYTALTGGTEAGTACTTASFDCRITGLAANTTYYYSVVATNAAGNSVATSPRVLVQPAALPGAPTISSVTPGNAFLSVAFSAGSADANAPITSYQYTLNDGTTWLAATSNTSPIIISDLTNSTGRI